VRDSFGGLGRGDKQQIRVFSVAEPTLKTVLG
jgi:hypothetical protein